MTILGTVRYEALLDFLAEAVSVEGQSPFPDHVLAALRNAIPCDALSYREWIEDRLVASTLAADGAEERERVWSAYIHFRHDDPLPGGPGSVGDRRALPEPEWIGKPLTISDVVSERDFRRCGLYSEICRPFGVRSVMKLFLPTECAVGAAFVFDTSRNEFSLADRLVLQRLWPHLVQLRRNAQTRQSYADLPTDKTSAGHALRRLTPREQVVLARASAGETNDEIARALFISVGTVRKHLEHIFEKLEVRNRAAASAVFTRAASSAEPSS